MDSWPACEAGEGSNAPRRPPKRAHLVSARKLARYRGPGTQPRPTSCVHTIPSGYEACMREGGRHARGSAWVRVQHPARLPETANRAAALSMPESLFSRQTQPSFARAHCPTTPLPDTPPPIPTHCHQACTAIWLPSSPFARPCVPRPPRQSQPALGNSRAKSCPVGVPATAGRRAARQPTVHRHTRRMMAAPTQNRARATAHTPASCTTSHSRLRRSIAGWCNLVFVAPG